MVPMAEVYVFRRNGKLMAVGTIEEIAQATGMTKRQISRRMHGDTDDSVIDVSPNRRDRRSMKARDMTCKDLRDKGLDGVQIQRLMGMSKAMVEAAFARGDSGRYEDTFADDLVDDYVAADVAVSALSQEGRDRLRKKMRDALYDTNPYFWMS